MRCLTKKKHNESQQTCYTSEDSSTELNNTLPAQSEKLSMLVGAFKLTFDRMHKRELHQKKRWVRISQKTPVQRMNSAQLTVRASHDDHTALSRSKGQKGGHQLNLGPAKNAKHQHQCYPRLTMFPNVQWLSMANFALKVSMALATTFASTHVNDNSPPRVFLCVEGECGLHHRYSDTRVFSPLAPEVAATAPCTKDCKI